MVRVVETSGNKTDILELKNEKMSVTVTNLGCTVMGLLVKDRDGEERDVVLGYDTTSEYLENTGYLGALLGRVANRIGGAAFELNGKTYHLNKNDGPNALHGGIHGFSQKVFEYTFADEEIRFRYVSEDGEEGYPGKLTLDVSYRLEEDRLVLRYQAVSDKDTIINLTNHSYFNLSGHPCNIEDHILELQADRYACVDANGLTTGEIRDVSGTPFDFRTAKQIRENIHQEDEQLSAGHGFDHPFIFSAKKDQAKLYCEESGIEMVVSTTLPQAQIYTGNFLESRNGKNGNRIDWRNGICIETQNMPDSIHNEKEPTVILRAGEQYDETTSYRFNVR